MLWVVPCSAGRFAQAADDEAAASLPTNTGRLGDPDRLMFYGNETFSADQILDGLVMNPEFLMSSHPVAPFAEYLEVIKAKVKAGYRRAGFADVDALVRFDEFTGKILVRIKEGARYVSADISVEGAPEHVKEAIIKGLTKETPDPPGAKEKDPNDCPAKETEKVSLETSASGQLSGEAKRLWTHGKAADFSALHLKAVKHAVRLILSQEGYFFPWVDVDVVAAEDKKTARLVVKVQDLGPQGVVDEITVEGNTKNTREEILDYLGLKPGMNFNSKVVARTERLLRDSARFLHYKISPHPEFSKEARLKLNIEVKEYEHAPPLGQKYSKLQKTMLGLCDYLSTWQDGTDDIVVGYRNDTLQSHKVDRLELVISPKKGILLLAWQDAQVTDAALLGAILVGSDEIALYSPKHGEKIALSGFSKTILLYFTIQYYPDGETDKPFTVSLQGGIATGPSDVPYRLRMDLMPVFFMREAHFYESSERGYSFSYEDDVLKCRNEESEMTVDAATSRPLEMQIETSKGDFVITTESRAFDKRMAEIDKASGEYVNVLDGENPVGSILSLVLEQYVRNKIGRSPSESDSCRQGPSPQRVVEVLRKVIPPSLGGMFSMKDYEHDDTFSVPYDFTAGENNATNNLAAAFAATVFRVSNNLFAQGSWPWTLSRETVFIFGGMGKYSLAELGRIYESEDTGPLGYLTTAKVLSQLSPRLSGAFAAKGLSRMSVEAFRKDVRVFLEGDSKLARCLIETADAIRGLDDAERDALLLVFDAEHTEVVGRSIDMLRKDKSTPVKEVIPAACDELWREFLKKKVEAALSKLATQYSAMNNR